MYVAALLGAAAVAILALGALGGWNEQGRKVTQADTVFASDALTGARDGVRLARTARTLASHAPLRQLAGQLEIRERTLLADPSLGVVSSRLKTRNSSTRTTETSDRALIDDLIRHRQADAITARIQLRIGENQALKSLARSLLEQASLDTERLNSWRKEWYGATSPEGSVL